MYFSNYLIKVLVTASSTKVLVLLRLLCVILQVRPNHMAILRRCWFGPQIEGFDFWRHIHVEHLVAKILGFAA